MIRLVVARAVEFARIAIGKCARQVVHPANLDAIEAGLHSANHGSRRRAAKQLRGAMARDVVVA